MIFETHAHYDDEAFDEDRQELFSGFVDAGIDKVVNIGVTVENSISNVELISKYDFLYGTVGVHPNEVGELKSSDIEILRQLATKDKVVAIGEIGLDYYYDEPPRAVQKKWFEAQSELAREIQLPMVVHSRDAAKDTVDMMKTMRAGDIGGVVHCFSYTKEVARDFLKMDFYFGIGGVITFKNAKKLKEAVEYIPLDKIVLETDCPYLAPDPYRGKRNSSHYLPYVIEAIADIKGVTAKEVEEITYANANKLYRIKE